MVGCLFGLLYLKELKAIERKVAVVPGNAFYDDDSKPCQSFRMNFSMPSDEDIVKGVAILGELMHD